MGQLVCPDATLEFQSHQSKPRYDVLAVHVFKSLLKCFRTGDLINDLRKIEGSCKTDISSEDSFWENLNIMLLNAQFHTGHHIANPNNALYLGEIPKKLPYLCCLFDPKNGSHLMIPKFNKSLLVGGLNPFEKY